MMRKSGRLFIPASKGIVEICAINLLTKAISQFERFRNTTVYEGIDILGKLLAGQDININTMYMEFTNLGSTPTVVVDPAEGRSYYAAMDTGLTGYDYIRVPLTAEPVLSSTDATKFSANKASFFAMSTGATVGQGSHLFETNSKVYGVALVAAADPADATQDLVFARSYNFTAKTKLTGEEISIAWSQIFGEENMSST
jgi:hypothetical protein